MEMIVSCRSTAEQDGRADAPVTGAASWRPGHVLVWCGMWLAGLGIASVSASSVDYSAFHRAVAAGDAQAALEAGHELYTRLAYRAGGQGVFSQAGTLLTCCEEAAEGLLPSLVAMCRDASQPRTSSMVDTYRGSMQPMLPQLHELTLSGDEQGRFLAAYVRLSVDDKIGKVLAAIAGPASPAPDLAAAAADYLAFMLMFADEKGGADQPNFQKAMDWLSLAGQGGRAIDQCMAYGRPGLACEVCKAMLSRKPSDRDARRDLVTLVAALCKSQRVQEALSVCSWAEDITHDAAYSTVLVLQQAVIIGRDQKNYALAIRMCDAVSSRPGEQSAMQLARYMAGVFCQDMQDFAGAARRMKEMAEDATTAVPYRLKASLLCAKAFQSLGRTEDAVQVLSAALANLAEPEPVDAAECRQMLCQSLLMVHRRDQAAEQAQVLLARHPGHPAAEMAARILRQADKSPDVRSDR